MFFFVSFKLSSIDCSIFDSADPITEPMVGLCDLLLGGAQMALKNYQLSMDAYNRCICKRLNTIDEDMHVSAFAHYELATLKLHCHRNVCKHLLGLFL